MSYTTRYQNRESKVPDTTNRVLVKETPFGECWLWGEGTPSNAVYIVVHKRVGNHFESWFSTNHIDVVNKYIEPNQLALDFGDDFTVLADDDDESDY